MCGGWSSRLVVFYIGANVVIAAAYFCIPLMMFWSWAYQRRAVDVRQWQTVLFALFTASCGIGHLMDGFLPFFYPAYRMIALWHWLTAAVSLATLFAMPYFAKRLWQQKP